MQTRKNKIDQIPDENPFKIEIVIPTSSYINNARHWNRYKRNQFSRRIAFTSGDVSVYHFKKDTITSMGIIRVHTRTDSIKSPNIISKKTVVVKSSKFSKI